MKKKTWIHFVEDAKRNILNVMCSLDKNKPEVSIDSDLLNIQKAIVSLEWALKLRKDDKLKE